MIDKREGDVEAEHTRESVILYVCVRENYIKTDILLKSTWTTLNIHLLKWFSELRFLIWVWLQQKQPLLHKPE